MKLTYITILMGLACLFASCNGHDSHENSEAKEAGDTHEHGENAIFIDEHDIEKLGIKTREVVAGKFKDAIEVSGKIMPARGSQKVVVAKTSGIVAFPHGIVEGSSVNNGGLICRISSKGMQGCDPNSSARIAYDAAKAEFERIKPLYEEKLVSAQDFNTAKEAYELASNTYIGGGDGSSVNSPISGVLNKIYVEDGGYVEAGTAIASVTENRRLTLQAELPQKYLSLLPSISSANFKLPYSDSVFELTAMNGRRITSGNTTAFDTGYVELLFEFDNKGDIVPGSYADIYLLCKQRDNVISVPISALTEEMGYYYAYVEIGHGEFEKRKVEIGGENGSNVEILNGLHEKDQVVVEGAVLVKIAANSSVVPEGHHH